MGSWLVGLLGEVLPRLGFLRSAELRRASEIRREIDQQLRSAMPTGARAIRYHAAFYDWGRHFGIADWTNADNSTSKRTDLPEPLKHVEQRVSDLLRELRELDRSGADWNHARVTVEARGPCKIEFAHVPDEDSWTDLPMRGVSDLTLEEAEAKHIPAPDWAAKVKLGMARREREAADAAADGRKDVATRLETEAATLRSRLADYCAAGGWVKPDEEAFYDALFAPLRAALGEPDPDMIAAFFGFRFDGPLGFRTFGAGRDVTTYVSCELALTEDHLPGPCGRYELLCSSDDMQWVRSVLTAIGRMSRSVAFRDGQTMDIGAWVNDDESTPPLQGVMFVEACRMQFDDQPYGILRVIGITRPEMEYAQKHGSAALVHRLAEAGHYPDTIVGRASAV